MASNAQPESEHLHEVLRLDLNYEEWQAVHNLIQVGVAAMNGDPQDCILMWVEFHRHCKDPDVVNGIISRIADAGEKAFHRVKMVHLDQG